MKKIQQNIFQYFTCLLAVSFSLIWPSLGLASHSGTKATAAFTVTAPNYAVQLQLVAPLFPTSIINKFGATMHSDGSIDIGRTCASALKAGYQNSATTVASPQPASWKLCVQNMCAIIIKQSPNLVSPLQTDCASQLQANHTINTTNTGNQ